MYTGWGDQSWIKQFFLNSIQRPSCLIKAYGGPETYWLVCVGLLAAHEFNINLIFLKDSIPVVAERAARFVDVFRC
jgi:hypothetical protein